MAGAGNLVAVQNQGVPSLEEAFQAWDEHTSVSREGFNGCRLTVEGTAEPHPEGMEGQGHQAVTRQAGEVVLEAGKVVQVEMEASKRQE